MKRMNDVNHAIVLETTFDRRYCNNDYRTATLQRITLGAMSFMSNWQCGRRCCWGGEGVSVVRSSSAAAEGFTELCHGGHSWSAYVAPWCVPFVVKNFNLENALNSNLVAEIIVNEFLRKKRTTIILRCWLYQFPRKGEAICTFLEVQWLLIRHRLHLLCHCTI